MLTASVEYTSLRPPTHYALAFEPYLYNQTSFLRLKEYEVQSFYAVDHARELIIARIHFAMETSLEGSLCAISLPQLPFGSLEYSLSINIAQLTDFVVFVRDQLTQRGITSVEIRDCIPAYRVDEAKLLHQALLDQDFVVQEEAVNHHIPVDERELSTKMSAGQRGKLKKCVSASFTSARESIDELSEVYSFVEMSYQARKRFLSLPLSALQESVCKFPDQYQLFSVYYLQKRIAACVAVRVSLSALYTFYYTALASYGTYSPTVLLLDTVYQYCQSQKISVLDLGTSSAESVRKFKARMGGVSSEKYTYFLALG